MSEQVLVFPSNLISESDFTENGGIVFEPSKIKGIRDVIFNGVNLEFVERGPAEENELIKQVIPYLILVNEKGEYFCYARSKKGNESRLHTKYSIGLGGHVNPEDMLNPSLTNISLLNCIVRELQEEVNINLRWDFSLENIALLNDQSDAVGRVHFGFVFLLRLNTADLSIKLEDALAKGEFVPWKHLKYYENLENWSKLLVDKVLPQYHEAEEYINEYGDELMNK
jgi:predicted NUDIX family phosphoesterase